MLNHGALAGQRPTQSGVLSRVLAVSLGLKAPRLLQLFRLGSHVDHRLAPGAPLRGQVISTTYLGDRNQVLIEVAGLAAPLVMVDHSGGELPPGAEVGIACADRSAIVIPD